MRDAVEEAEQEDRERDGAEARSAATAATDDRDANHLVAAARQRNAAHGRGAAGSGEREHGRPLVTRKRRCQPHAFAA